MQYAVADTGSNTIRLGIYDYENGSLVERYNEAVFANLAGHIRENRLSTEGIDVATDAILKHIETTKTFSCPLHVFATAAIRNAENTEEICDAIFSRTGCTVDVLTGNEEAVFSFYGAKEDFSVKRGIMADVGGGSSEIILFSESAPVSCHSLPWGSLKAFRTFVEQGLPTIDQIHAIQDTITALLSSYPPFCGAKEETLCIVGGGVRASQKLAQALLENASLSISSIDALLDMIIKNPTFTRSIIERITPRRADTIAPALAIYSACGHFFGARHIAVSDKGIKEGYILKRLIGRE